MKNTLLFYLMFILLHYGCSNSNELGLNEEASMDSFGDLPENPLLLNAISSSIYPKDSTMSVLYGNNVAYNYATVNGNGSYPNGSVLYEVIWQLQADEQWFGANIPKMIKRIERIEFTGNNTPIYEVFEKGILKKAKPGNMEERINYIASKRMAVSP